MADHPRPREVPQPAHVVGVEVRQDNPAHITRQDPAGLELRSHTVRAVDVDGCRPAIQSCRKLGSRFDKALRVSGIEQDHALCRMVDDTAKCGDINRLQRSARHEERLELPHVACAQKGEAHLCGLPAGGRRVPRTFGVRQLRDLLRGCSHHLVDAVPEGHGRPIAKLPPGTGDVVGLRSARMLTL